MYYLMKFLIFGAVSCLTFGLCRKVCTKWCTLGKKFGVTSVLVLSGETQPEDVDAALPADQPDFAFGSLDDVDRIMF